MNPYGNSIIANGAWLKANRDKADKFVKITQKAFADCAKNPTLASRRWSKLPARCSTRTSWTTGISSPS